MDNYITQCLGMPDVKPDFYILDKSKYDSLVLTSDGIHDILKMSEIGYIVHSGESLEEIANNLIDASMSSLPIKSIVDGDKRRKKRI